MKKAETIERYGEEAYEKLLEQRREWYKANKEEEKVAGKKYREQHPEKVAAWKRKYNEENPEKVIAHNQERTRKGGNHYDKHLKDSQTGLQGDRNRIRKKHAKQYKPYKDIIALESQLHHEWVPKTDEYRGVALVEAEQHMHGFVDVIEILDGKITLLTEEEIKKVIQGK